MADIRILYYQKTETQVFPGEEGSREGSFASSKWVGKRIFLWRLEMEKENAHEKHYKASC